MRWKAVLAGVLLAWAWLPSASAQQADADPARAGIELRRMRRDAEALEAFRRAYADKPTPRILAQIALAEQALGKWVLAERDLEKALEAKDDTWIKERRTLLLEGLEGIRRHLGWVEVTVDTPGASLWINGEAFGAVTGKAMRVEAGSVVLDVRTDGYLPVRRVSSVEPGAVARESVHLVETRTEPARAKIESQEPSSVRPIGGEPRALAPDGRAPDGFVMLRRVAYVAVGAGVLAAGIGGYYGVLTTQNEMFKQLLPTVQNGRTQQSKLASGSIGTEIVLDQQASVDRLRSTVWLVAGLIAAGTGGALLLWATRPVATDDKTAATHFVPQIGADRLGATVGLEGQW